MEVEKSPERLVPFKALTPRASTSSTTSTLKSWGALGVFLRAAFLFLVKRPPRKPTFALGIAGVFDGFWLLLLLAIVPYLIIESITGGSGVETAGDVASMEFTCNVTISLKSYDYLKISNLSLIKSTVGTFFVDDYLLFIFTL